MTQLDEKAFAKAKEAFHGTYRHPDGPLRGALTAYLAALANAPAPVQTPISIQKAADKLRDAGDKLSFAAQTSGGTAGRDEGLCAAISDWSAARDCYVAVKRIERFEPAPVQGDGEAGWRDAYSKPAGTPESVYQEGYLDGLKAAKEDRLLLVPREPTDEMIEMGEECIQDRQKMCVRVYASDVYEAMIAAAPVANGGENE